MLERVGLALLTFADASLADMVELGRTAESLGYARTYTTESLTDTLALDLAIALGTTTMLVGSFVALASLRHPSITAQAAVVISDLSRGRFILGLGPGHAMRNRALGAPPQQSVAALRGYAEQVLGVLGGRGREVYPALPDQRYQGRRLEFRTPLQPVPVHLSAVGPRMAEMAGEIADGVMLYLTPRRGIAEVRAAVGRGAATGGRPAGAVEVSLGVHAFVDLDEDRARSAARDSLSYWVGLDAYNASIRRAGFEAEARALRGAFLTGDQALLRSSISDALIDEFCLVGSPARCREGLQALLEAGADFVSVMPDPVQPWEPYADAVRRTLLELVP